MTLLRHLHLAIVVAVVCAVDSAVRSLDKDQQNLRKHLGEIRGILDEAHSPCSNFPKYACGHYHNVSGGESYPNDRVYLSELADDLNKLTDVELESTQKAKDFLESCQKQQSPKNILKVDLFKKTTHFELAPTLGILKTSGIDAIIRTHINVLDERKVRLIISLDQDLFLSTAFSDKNNKRNLELLGVPASERSNAEKKVNDFIHKGKAILVNSKENAIVGTDVEAIKNFDWDEYLDQLKNMPKLGNAKLEFVLEDVVNIQKILDLVAQTDPPTLLLVTALEFMAEVIETSCDVVVDYFRMPIFAEFYHLYFKDADKAFNIDVLKEFEKSHAGIKSKVNNLSPGVLGRVKEKMKIIANMDRLLDPARIDKEYKDVEVDPENFYQNYLNVAKFKIHKYLSNSSSKEESAEQYLMNLLNPVNRQKPAFYHFASQGLYLWQLFFRENRPKYSYDKLRSCLEEQEDKYHLFKLTDLDYFDYVEQFAAMKQTYLDFQRYWDHEYDPSHKLDSTFKEFHLTPDQAFFLNLAQRECSQVNSGKNIPFRIMLNLEDVSRAFNCQLSSQLNIEEKCSVW